MVVLRAKSEDDLAAKPSSREKYPASKREVKILKNMIFSLLVVNLMGLM